MPLLKYRCKACNLVFDTLVSVSRMDAVLCEKCNGPVERAYEGACLFGMQGSGAGRGGSCSGNCEGCTGCSGGHAHGAGCGCGGCH